MGHPGDADELLEVSGDELGSVVGDDPRLGIGEEFTSSLEDDLHIRLGHRLSDLPVDDEPAVAVEDAAEVVEGAVDVDVGDVDVPVVVWSRRVMEPRALLGRGELPAAHQAGSVEDSPGARRADGHDVLIEHHKGQTPVAIEGVFQVEADDGILLPILEPVIAGDLPVVLVGLAVPFLPIVELADADLEPADEVVRPDLGLLRPEIDEVDDRVTRVWGDPPAV